MGVTKQTVKPGNGVDVPKKGDTVTMAYNGYVYDRKNTRQGGRGRKFDTSKNRGDVAIKLGGGSVIRGWEIGVMYANGGMSLGEEATITIPWQSAYGENGFPGLIPPRADLIFDVRLRSINGKRA